MLTPDVIPADYEVQPLDAAGLLTAKDAVTCGTCGLSWDDGKVTGMTPTPSARCPFEAWHLDALDDGAVSSNYGTLSSDYDAGYDDGRSEGFTEGLRAVALILADHDDWNGDTFDAIVLALNANGVEVPTRAEES